MADLWLAVEKLRRESQLVRRRSAQKSLLIPANAQSERQKNQMILRNFATSQTSFLFTKPASLRFRMGKVGTADLDEECKGQVFAFTQEQVILHPNYTAGQAYYDVAVIHLEQPIRFGAKVKAVILPWAADLDADARQGQYISLLGMSTR